MIKKKLTKYWCTEQEWNNMSISPDDIQGTAGQVWLIKQLHKVWNGEASSSLCWGDYSKLVRAEAKRTYKPNA